MTRTPAGRRVFQLTAGRRGSAVAVFDPLTGRFVPTAWVAPYALLLGCPAEDEAIVYSGEALCRLRFGSDAVQEIWRAR
jgi:hypothetical protein